MTDSKHSGRRILIIDDQNSIHEVFRTILLRPAICTGALNDLESELFGDPTAIGGDETSAESTSHVVEFAHQGEEGFLKLQAALERGEHFDLAFVDMQMPPGWNGIETIRQLWTLMPSLPVVVCTAYSEYSWIDICKMLGNTEQLNLLPKPFIAAEVHNIVNDVVSRAELSAGELVF
jgi:CheY-like chemotaxis protein